MASSFFIWCSGASEEILDKCPESEHIRQRNIGTFVFLTGIIAFCTSGYTLFSIYGDHYASILGGFFWAALIFNLDRFLVSTTPLVKERENYRLLKRYLIPRFLLAALIGIAIGTPFEMYLFKEEINTQIEKNLQKERSKEIDDLMKKQSDDQKKIVGDYNTEIKEIENKHKDDCKEIDTVISNINKTIEKLRERRTRTTLGDDGTKAICGHRCKTADAEIAKNDESLHEYENKKEFCEKTKNSDPVLVNLNSEKQKKLDKISESLKNGEEETNDRFFKKTKNSNSLLKKYKALSSLADEDNYIYGARWFFIGLFMFFEIAPLFAKFLAGVSNHDLFVYQEKEKIKIELENDNHKDRVTDWLEMEKVRRDGEKEKLNKEWNTFHTLHQSFLDKFNQSLTDKYHEVFDEWMVQFDSEPHIDEMDEHFREKFKEDLARFTEFSTYANSTVSNPNEHQPNDTEQSPTPESEENNKNLFESILDTFKEKIPEKIIEKIIENSIEKIPIGMALFLPALSSFF